MNDQYTTDYGIGAVMQRDYNLLYCPSQRVSERMIRKGWEVTVSGVGMIAIAWPVPGMMEKSSGICLGG